MYMIHTVIFVLAWSISAWSLFWGILYIAIAFFSFGPATKDVAHISMMVTGFGGIFLGNVFVKLAEYADAKMDKLEEISKKKKK